jgi:hypothetical protein
VSVRRFAPAEAVSVGEDIGAAAPTGPAAQRGETFPGAAGGGPGAEAVERVQRRLRRVDVAAELGDGRVVEAAPARPLLRGGLPVPAGLQLERGQRVLVGGLGRAAAGQLGPAAQVSDHPRVRSVASRQ